MTTPTLTHEQAGYIRYRTIEFLDYCGLEDSCKQFIEGESPEEYLSPLGKRMLAEYDSTHVTVEISHVQELLEVARALAAGHQSLRGSHPEQMTKMAKLVAAIHHVDEALK